MKTRAADLALVVQQNALWHAPLQRSGGGVRLRQPIRTIHLHVHPKMRFGMAVFIDLLSATGMIAGPVLG